MSKKIIRKLTQEEIMNLLKIHSNILKKYKVKRIGLFGSYVSGKQRTKSDIDFLVDFEKATFDNFMDLAFSLENLFGKKVDLITEYGLSPYVRPYILKEIKWYEV